jgi:hypothetical protein
MIYYLICIAHQLLAVVQDNFEDIVCPMAGRLSRLSGSIDDPLAAAGGTSCRRPPLFMEMLLERYEKAIESIKHGLVQKASLGLGDIEPTGHVSVIGFE